MRRVDVAGLALKHGTRLGFAGADHPTGIKGEELKAGFRATGRASGLIIDLRVRSAVSVRLRPRVSHGTESIRR